MLRRSSAGVDIMPETTQAAVKPEPPIKHFPVAFFAMLLGLIGLSIAWEMAQATFGAPLDFAGALRWLGTLDAFARVLYYSSMFLTLLLLTLAGRFVRLHYCISWWAYSFPLAAVSIATLIMFQLTGLLTVAVVGWTLLSLVSLVVIFLLYRTAVAVGGRTICVPHL